MEGDHPCEHGVTDQHARSGMGLGASLNWLIRSVRGNCPPDAHAANALYAELLPRQPQLGEWKQTRIIDMRGR